MRSIDRTHVLLIMLCCLLVATALRVPQLIQIPPGVHYDEAANGVLATEIGMGGKTPIFISSYTGKEVLFFYLAGALMRLLGGTVFALRLTAVFVSLLTIAATYWVGMELCRDRRIALMAAALLAVSFWHVLLSRLGFRAISQPLLQALTVAALFRGYRHNSWPWVISGGIFLGLAAYTYLAVRLFPVMLLIALLPVLLTKTEWLRRWQQTSIFGLTALLVSLPLLYYFWQHPDAFWVRISQVSPGQNTLPLSESILKSVEMLFLQGDPYVRFNLPGRPLFDWFWGGLLVVGWLVLLSRWRSLSADWQRSGYLLLILAPLIMLLPTALAVNEIVPSNLRAVGLIPFIFFLPPIGLMTLLDDIYKRFQQPEPTLGAVIAVAILLIVGGLYTERLYFRQWGIRNDLFLETDGDLTAVAPFLDNLDKANKEIFVAALHYRHPTLAFLSKSYGDIKWLPESKAVVFPPEKTAVIIYPANSPLPAWASSYFSQAKSLPTADTPDGGPAFLAYELTQPPSLSISHPVGVDFGGSIILLGYDLEDGTPDQTLPLTLYWQVSQPQSGDFTPFVHLEDSQGQRWSQVETFAYPASQWSPGEIIVQRVDVPVPAGAPPGDYSLRVGLFSGSTGELLPLLDVDGRYAGSAFHINNVPVLAAGLPDVIPQPPFPLEKEIRPYLRLLGFERGGPQTFTGEPYGVALWWLATREVPATTTQFVLVHPSGSETLLLETQPVYNTYPFTTWQPPQFIIDRQLLTIPTDLPADDYQLVVRFLDETENIIKRASLGPLTVKTAQRLFTPPPFESSVNALFGNEITLLGYSLNPTNDPHTYTLNLIWQAEQAPAADYTVFVHLLQPDGSCAPCTWQQDSMPQQGQSPTTRWQAGEVVIDSYQIVMPETSPPGSYLLEVGLYTAENGRRLQVSLPDGSSSDAVFLEPINKE